MNKYKIFDKDKKLLNVIIADENFVNEVYPGCFELVEDVQPTQTKYINKNKVIGIFSSDYINIISASKTDALLEAWLDKFKSVENFPVEDPDFISEIQVLVTKNLITQDKANEILGL